MRPIKKLFAWVSIALVAALGLALAQDIRPAGRGGDAELVFFFSDTTRDLELAARNLRGLRAKHPSLRIRPVLLVADFKSLAKPTTEFAAGIRELNYAIGREYGVRVYDEDGLALAKNLNLDRLPAYALIAKDEERQQAAVTYGTRANLEELLRCRK